MPSWWVTGQCLCSSALELETPFPSVLCGRKLKGRQVTSLTRQLSSALVFLSKQKEDISMQTRLSSDFQEAGHYHTSRGLVGLRCVFPQGIVLAKCLSKSVSTRPCRTTEICSLQHVRRFLVHTLSAMFISDLLPLGVLLWVCCCYCVQASPLDFLPSLSSSWWNY